MPIAWYPKEKLRCISFPNISQSESCSADDIAQYDNLIAAAGGDECPVARFCSRVNLQLGMGNISILSYIVILRAHDNRIVVVLQLTTALFVVVESLQTRLLQQYGCLSSSYLSFNSLIRSVISVVFLTYYSLSAGTTCGILAKALSYTCSHTFYRFNSHVTNRLLLLVQDKVMNDTDTGMVLFKKSP